MATRGASLRVRGPDGHTSASELTAATVTVGRASPDNQPDLPLGPDVQRWVGRLHCTLDLAGGIWSVTDNASVNGTLLRRDATTERLRGRAQLRHGDTILILGDMTESGEALYWELTLLDPHTTRPAPVPSAGQDGAHGAGLHYDWVSATAYRCANGSSAEIEGLRPQGHQLLRYMADRSQGAVAVACEHEELIRALWGEKGEWPAHRSYNRTDLAGVVRAVRLRIEPNPSEPQILETVTGLGYRLRVCSHAQAGGS